MTRARRDPLTVAIAAAAVVVTLATALLSDPVWLRIALTLPLVFVLPGWALQRALLRDRPRDPLYVAGYAIGLSLVVAVLGSVALAAAGLLSGAAWAGVLGGVTLVACAGSLARGPAAATAPPSSAARRSVRVNPGAAAAAVAALLLLGGAIALARTPLPVPADRGYTELSFGVTSAGAESVDVRVESSEAEDRRFVLRLTVPGRSVERRPVELAPGEAVVEPVAVSRSARGTVRAELLVPGEDGPEVYRRIRLRLPIPDPAPAVPDGEDRR